MDRIYLCSEAIEYIRYDIAKKSLDVCFMNGDYFRYFDVSPGEYLEMIEAECAMKYLDTVIKRNASDIVKIKGS